MNDFSALVTALQQNDDEKIDRLMQTLRPRLMAFLRIHMNASTEDAEDCVQNTLIMAMKAIKADKVRHPDYVAEYIFSICKNNYLRVQRKQRETSLEETSAVQEQAPRQLKSLLNKEQKRILKSCMNQLKKAHQKFMQYWFDFPDVHAQKVADYFDISINSAWTRKHRLIKKLHECYQKKSKL